MKQHLTYTHRNIEFEWHGKLNVCLPRQFLPLKLTLNNGSAGWRLSSKVFISVKQLKKIIKDTKIVT